MRPRVPAIVSKAEAVRSRRHLSRLLHDRLEQSAKAACVPIDCGRSDHTEAVQNKQSLLRFGEDFVPSSTPKIRLFGLVRQAMGHYFPDVDQVAPAVLKDELLRWWSAATEGHRIVASSAVFSLHPEIAAGLSERGISVGEVLFANAARAMEVYARRYYPGEEIGWVGGVHHDRKHPNLHALIYPLTSGGKRLNLSPLTPVSDGNGGTVGVDFHGTLALAYWEQCTKTAAMVFGLPNAKPLDPATVAAEVATGIAAARAAQQISGGKPPTPEDFQEGIKATEAGPVENLKAILGDLAALNRQPIGPDYPQQVGQFLVAAAELRQSIQARREAAACTIREIRQARSRALLPRYGAAGLGRHLAYNQASHPPATSQGKPLIDTFGPMIQEQADRTYRYHTLVGHLGKNADRARYSTYVLRVLAATGVASVLTGKKTGRGPFFLLQNPQKPPEVRRFLQSDRSRQLAEQFTEIMAKNGYELRPFTVEEFGNRSVSPYRPRNGPGKMPPADAEVAMTEPRDEIEGFVAHSQRFFDIMQVPGILDTYIPEPPSIVPSLW